MAKIFLVEDDTNIMKNLTTLLEEEGFEVLTASSKKEAEAKIEAETFDLALLDITLPDGTGHEVCSAIKKDTPSNKNSNAPVIFITAYDDEASAVASLDMGADDYITKPFRPRELVSRIRNALKRTGSYKSVFHLGDIRVDSLKGTVHKKDQEVFLSVLEYRLLLVFLNNQGEVLSREKLLEDIWDVAGEYVNDNTLTVYIKRLREKIEDDPQEPKIIKTVRGVGYKVEKV